MKHRTKKNLWVYLLGLTLASSPAFAAPTTLPTTAAARESADVAAVKVDRKGQPDKRFMQLHESFLKRAKEGDLNLLFLGDSITEGWNSRAKELFASEYGKYKPANFGSSGDRTQHVLWRIENGELDGISPKVLVLMIGTNNIGSPVEEITQGDVKIVKEIHEKLPETKVLLLGIFPRGAVLTDKRVVSQRDKIKQVNVELAKLDDGSKTRYLDIGDKFLDANGNITKDIMPDGLHPSAKGYQIWVDAMKPLLDEMMK